MAHSHFLVEPVATPPVARIRDPHLERLTALADGGGSGVDLSKMDRDEIRRRLLKR